MTILDLLREKGLKVTPQRTTILEYLEADLSHPTADTIYNEVAKKLPGLSLATVYNTLETLSNEGVIQKIKIGSENIVNYDLVKHSHHHFYCKACGKIYDIEIACPNMDKKLVQGHQIDECHGYFKGICKKCGGGKDKK